MFENITRDPIKIISAIIASTLLLSSLKYGIGWAEIVIHTYQKHDKIISEAIGVTEVLCNDSNILMKWDSINELCKQKFAIASRSVIWETIVESSDYFHICYVKKHVHDETKKFGHSHSSDQDVEMDCSYLVYFFLAFFIISIFYLFVYKRIIKHLNTKKKRKNE